MILADDQIPYLLHLESFFWYMRKDIKLDIAINYVCYWFMFVVSTRSKPYKNANPLISQFLQIYHQLLHSKGGNQAMDRIG